MAVGRYEALGRVEAVGRCKTTTGITVAMQLEPRPFEQIRDPS